MPPLTLAYPCLLAIWIHDTQIGSKMNLNRRHFIGASVAAGAGLLAPFTLAKPGTEVPRPVMPIEPEPPLGPPTALQQALAALDRHSAQIPSRDRIGIADFSLHSKEMRFHLVDVAEGRIAKSYLVSHGRGSDPKNSGFAERFSNRPGSNASSRGSFLTGEAYHGKHGPSRRLHGLERHNDQAFPRAIVIHGADYVDRRMAIGQGRIGRSLGCFAFERDEIGEILDRLGQGRLLFTAGQSASFLA